MLCDNCKQRPASVRVTKIINNVRSDMNLCHQCAKEKGELEMFEGPKFGLANLLTGLLQNEPPIGITMSVPNVSKRACEKCGIDYSEFANTGFLGCSECYEQFGGRLEPVIGRIHGSTRHTGKVPKRTGQEVRFRQELEMLRTELRRLIEAEEYEKAAILRDRIKGLERTRQSSGEAGESR